ncbi:hypothetical protein YC2023_043834 [Brassica napus]
MSTVKRFSLHWIQFKFVTMDQSSIIFWRCLMNQVYYRSQKKQEKESQRKSLDGEKEFVRFGSNANVRWVLAIVKVKLLNLHLTNSHR